PEASGTACSQNGGTKCNGSGTNPACVQCLEPRDSSGTDTECHMRTCSSTGMCGVSNTANGTPVSSQTAGDCKKNVCMSGAQVSINDNTDVLVDGNGCTMDLCTNGMPSNPSLAADAPCSENGGTRRNGGATAPPCGQRPPARRSRAIRPASAGPATPPTARSSRTRCRVTAARTSA